MSLLYFEIVTFMFSLGCNRKIEEGRGVGGKKFQWKSFFQQRQRLIVHLFLLHASRPYCQVENNRQWQTWLGEEAQPCLTLIECFYLATKFNLTHTCEYLIFPFVINHERQINLITFIKNRNRRSILIDQKKKGKEKRLWKNRFIRSSTKAKPFEAVVSRSLYTYSTTNEYISF